MPDTLVETQQLAAELFPWEHEHQTALAAAVAPASHSAFLNKNQLSSVEFWTPLKDNRVAGLAGLYHYSDRPAEAWLAWYGLRASARGHGQGTQLLHWIIRYAVAQKKDTLRLWTTDEAEYAKALALYKAHGFRAESWPALPGETWNTFVLTLSLDGHEPLPWSQCHPHGELCGRETPHLVAA